MFFFIFNPDVLGHDLAPPNLGKDIQQGVRVAVNNWAEHRQNRVKRSCHKVKAGIKEAGTWQNRVKRGCHWTKQSQMTLSLPKTRLNDFNRWKKVRKTILVKSGFLNQFFRLISYILYWYSVLKSSADIFEIKSLFSYEQSVNRTGFCLLFLTWYQWCHLSCRISSHQPKVKT